MSRSIFVNIAVKDLERSKEFFSKLGFTFNPQFTDAKAACMIVSETIFVMLLVEPFFKTFIRATELADATKTTEALLSLSYDSRAAVDELFNLGITAGGKEVRPTEDLGFMYSRAVSDLDGHIWEFFWMDPSFVNKNS